MSLNLCLQVVHCFSNSGEQCFVAGFGLLDYGHGNEL